MNVLFLDVDGVLNSIVYLKQAKSGQWPQDHLDPDNILRLNEIVERTDCQIVLSSSWRIVVPDLKTFGEWMAAKGFKYADRIIGQTPNTRSADEVRGDEIVSWIKSHNEVDRLVILDDDSDMNEVMNHLVQTNIHYGLTELDVEFVCAKFNSPTSKNELKI
jgi:hypothetical protein